MSAIRTCRALLAFALVAPAVWAGSVTETITTPEARLERAGPYSEARLEAGFFPSDIEPGLPQLPCLIRQIEVPPGAIATGVVVTCSDEVLATGVVLYPVQPARANSATGAVAFIAPSARAYAQASAYPAARAVLGGTHVVQGQAVASVLLYPFVYIADRGEVSVARTMTLTVYYEDGPAPAGAPGVRGVTQREYLIITKGIDMLNAFWPLGMYRVTNDGFMATARDVDGIVAMYPGRDKQERIRNCIKDYVNNYGTKYVVLGGDDTIVPDRNATAQVRISTPTGLAWCVDTAIPTDAYYSNLDGTWDANSNKVYGELTDNVDFGVDVWVGRIPVRTPAQASNYVDKLMAYEKEVQGYAGRLCMGGMTAWDTYANANRPNDSTSDGLPGFRGHDPVSDTEMWGRRLYRDWIANSGYAPQRLDFYYDTVTSLDTNWAGEYEVSGSMMAGLLSEGWFHVAYDGHGTPSGIAAEGGVRFDVAAVNWCQSPPVGVFQSVTCLAGAFDDATVEPCFSEALLRRRTGGALAYVGSSRNGWGTFDPPPASDSSTGGASYDFAQQFYSQVFTNRRTTLGSAFGYHKSALAGLATGDGSHRWLEFAINLQGDPALHLPDLADTTAPTPNPSLWATPPVALSPTSVTMTAATASDASGVEYRFVELSGGGRSTTWQASPVYTDSSLLPGFTYRYMTQARDTSINHNETTPALEASVTTPLELLNDAWDPADDAVASATVLEAPVATLQSHGPHTLSATDTGDWFQIWLSAGSSNLFQTAGGTGDNFGELFSDAAGSVRVAFDDDGSGGGQFALTYLAPVTASYYLRVRAFTSGSACGYTLKWSGAPADPSPPIPNPMRFAEVPLAPSPSTIVMNAMSAEDASGVEYLFEETTGHAGGESGTWQDGTTFANTNVQPDTVYAYRVRARDKSVVQNLTDWSEIRQVATPPIVPHDAWDPADDAGVTGTALMPPTVGEQTHGEHTLNGTDEEDWFAIYLEAGTTNHFRSISTMGDPVAYLSRQADGGQLYAWDDDSGGDGNFAVQFVPPVSDTYYLRVIAYAASGPCIYNLAWQRGWMESDLTLAEALDTEGEVWGTGGDTNWTPTLAASHDSVDSALASGLLDDQAAYLFKVVNGPGSVGFWWRASTELNYDFLSFAVDDVTNHAISGEADWKYVVQHVGAGSHDLRWTFAKDYSSSNGTDEGWVDQFSFTPDGSPLPLFRSGDAEWFAQPDFTHDGVSAEQSGLLRSNQWTRLQTFVEGPGTLVFWCKTSSELNYDFLHMSVDGRTNLSLSGQQDWQARTVTVWRVGPRDVSWIYQKDATVDDGLDAAWVDEIVWTPIPMDRDTDGDGQYDWQEGVAGVDPFNSNSLFRLERPLAGYRSAEGGFVIEWQSSTGVFYAIDYAPELTGSFYQIQTQIPGEAGRTHYDCGTSEAGFEFYRVRVDE